MTRAMMRRTSAPVNDPAACNTKHSRVYSSTKVSHLRERPSAVRSWMKSQVQTSFLNRAGCRTQLFALTPGLGPNFLGFLSLTGLLSPRLIQSRLTRLILTDHPCRINTAWTRRYPKRGCRRANRLISRFRAGSSVRRLRRYRRHERDRPITWQIRRWDTPYRSSR